jgi:hypothetical protein
VKEEEKVDFLGRQVDGVTESSALAEEKPRRPAPIPTMLTRPTQSTNDDRAGASAGRQREDGHRRREQAEAEVHQATSCAGARDRQEEAHRRSSSPPIMHPTVAVCDARVPTKGARCDGSGAAWLRCVGLIAELADSRRSPRRRLGPGGGARPPSTTPRRVWSEAASSPAPI